MIKLLKSRLKRYPSILRVYGRVENWRQAATDLLESWAVLSEKDVTSAYGFKLRTGHTGAHWAMRSGDFEREEVSHIRNLLPQSDVFVDVGANIGLYACIARQAGNHVIAVEPQAKNLRLLLANLIDNGWPDVEVYPTGLSRKVDIALLYGASGTGASLIPGWDSKSVSQTQAVRSMIPLSTLDILLGERFSGKKLLIKIDVEGAEYDVLLGSQNILRMSPQPAWLVEVCLNEYHPSGMNPNYAATFNLFWENGYEARTADAAKRLITPGDISRFIELGRCESGVINYLFEPKVSVDDAVNTPSAQVAMDASSLLIRRASLALRPLGLGC